MPRLLQLAEALEAVRQQKRPVVGLAVRYPAGSLGGGGAAVPFDAVSLPGSPLLQFLCRDASKPGRESESGSGAAANANANANAGDLWTAVSTSQFAGVHAPAWGTKQGRAAGERLLVERPLLEWSKERDGDTTEELEAAVSLLRALSAIVATLIRLCRGPLSRSDSDPNAVGDDDRAPRLALSLTRRASADAPARSPAP